MDYSLYGNNIHCHQNKKLWVGEGRKQAHAHTLLEIQSGFLKFLSHVRAHASLHNARYHSTECRPLVIQTDLCRY